MPKKTEEKFDVMKSPLKNFVSSTNPLYTTFELYRHNLQYLSDFFGMDPKELHQNWAWYMDRDGRGPKSPVFWNLSQESMEYMLRDKERDQSKARWELMGVLGLEVQLTGKQLNDIMDILEREELQHKVRAWLGQG